MGLLFDAMFSHNDNKGVLLGKRYMHCHGDKTIGCYLLSIKSNLQNIKNIIQQIIIVSIVSETTGYIYFPMPFWKSARIAIDSMIEEPINLSFEIGKKYP